MLPEDSEDSKVYYFDRVAGKKREERIFCGPVLQFLYGPKIGKWLGNLLAHFSLFSILIGLWYKLPFTKRNIRSFIQCFGIKTEEFAKDPTAFSSFNDFFIRKLKKEARPLAEGPIIPADGRYLFYQKVSSSEGFLVKGERFCLANLLDDPKLAEKYAHGSMLIARLAPSDYHRFHFPLDCTPGPARLINGYLHSVNPIAVRQNIHIFTENKRMITHLKTAHNGTILYIEIGATSVGTIHQTYTPNRPHQKGDEKGYFSFGGSSIIVLFEPGMIHFAPDLVHFSNQGYETLCLFGQPIERSI
jgi:phosphatidylserine decarboxylase